MSHTMRRVQIVRFDTSIIADFFPFMAGALFYPSIMSLAYWIHPGLGALAVVWAIFMVSLDIPYKGYPWDDIMRRDCGSSCIGTLVWTPLAILTIAIDPGFPIVGITLWTSAVVYVTVIVSLFVALANVPNDPI